MIRISLLKEGNKMGIQVEGHSGSAPSGKDLICAAVSSQIQMIEVGINGVLKKNLEIEKQKGNMKIPPQDDSGAQVLIQSFFLSAQILEKQYPDFIKTNTVRLETGSK
jgi:uncharacterized protein YsxB (DUF464 family)